MRTEMRFCADIGMFSLDRPIPETCVHATNFCRTNCFNDKLYRIYPAMRGKDARNERAWQACKGSDYASELQRKQKNTDRLRLMTRGECLKDVSDIARVRDICEANPKRLIWAPTRAWRDPILRLAIERELFKLPNLAILASLDPETSEFREELALSGWSTMFFGDDSESATEGHFKCPKTWKKIKGHCADCKAGCFAPVTLGRRVDVHLKQH